MGYFQRCWTLRGAGEAVAAAGDVIETVSDREVEGEDGDGDVAVAAHCASSAVQSVVASEELCSGKQSKKEDIKTTVRFRVKGYRERGDTALFGFPLPPP